MSDPFVLDVPLGPDLSRVRAQLAPPATGAPTLLAPLGAAALAAVAGLATAWIVIIGPGSIEADRPAGAVSAMIGLTTAPVAGGSSGVGAH